MAKAQSPLLGYNNNVRHRGRVFHIQTEDSGVTRPHVITHLFADGGRILKTAKTSYADRVEEPNLGVFVKKLMQDQHKAMFIALRDGQFDAMLSPLSKPEIVAVADAPVEAPPTGDAPPAVDTLWADAPVVPTAPVETPAAVSGAAVSGAAAPVVVVPLVAAAIIDTDLDGTLEIAPEDIPAFVAEMIEDDRPTAPTPRPVSDPEVPLALVPSPASPALPPPPPAEAIHRGSLPRSSLPPVRVAGLRPVTGPVRAAIEPPPATAPTAAPTVPPPAVPALAPPPPVAAAALVAPSTQGSSPPPLPRISQPPPLPGPGRSPQVPGRYVAPRPAASVAATTRPREVHASIFAESLVSERSLDEVILAYLAEELNNTPRT